MIVRNAIFSPDWSLVLNHVLKYRLPIFSLRQLKIIRVIAFTWGMPNPAIWVIFTIIIGAYYNITFFFCIPLLYRCLVIAFTWGVPNPAIWVIFTIITGAYRNITFFCIPLLYNQYGVLT